MAVYQFRANKDESDSINYFLSCEISKQYGTTKSEILKNLVLKVIAAPEHLAAQLPSVDPAFDKPIPKKKCTVCRKLFTPEKPYFHRCSDCQINSLS